MTYKEQLIKDHPTYSSEDVNIIIYRACPKDYDYDDKLHIASSNCSFSFSDHDHTACIKCWDREIPGTEIENNIEKEKKEMSTTRKTKDELLQEIKELRGEVEKLERYKKYEDTAGEVKALYDSYFNAGFTREQAFKLVEITISSSMPRR